MSAHNDPRLRDESAVSRYSLSNIYDSAASQYAHFGSAITDSGYGTAQSSQQLEQQQPIVNYSSALKSDDYSADVWSTRAGTATATAKTTTASSTPDEYLRSKANQTSASNAKTYDNFKNEAVALEAQKQKETFFNQRDEYMRKAKVLKNELKTLRLQSRDLNSDSLNSRDNVRLIRENSKLQSEIRDKLKSIGKVIDMLTGLIGDRVENVDYDSDTLYEYGDHLNGASNSNDMTSKRKSPTHSHPNQHSAQLNSDSTAAETVTPMPPKISSNRNVKFNYVHYDPEIHWCSVCDMFPKSAKDYLNHLHSHEHRVMIHEKQLNEAPWHKLPCEQEIPTNKDGPIKRIPIKGLQFFLSATAWYCKLCDQWIGDLHCASVHLKSRNHAHNYLDFTEYNPHWESDWMSDREKALEKSLITFNEKNQEQKQQQQLLLQKQQQPDFYKREPERHQADFQVSATEASAVAALAASSSSASSSLPSASASAAYLNENRVSQSYLDAEGKPLSSHKKSKASGVSLSSPVKHSSKSSKKKKKRRRQLSSKEKRKKSKKSKKRKKSSTTKSSRIANDDENGGSSFVSDDDDNDDHSSSSTTSSSSSYSSDCDSDSGSDANHVKRSSRASGVKRDNSLSAAVDRSKSIRVAMRNKSKSSQSTASVILNEEINDRFTNAAYLSKGGDQMTDFLKFTSTKESIGERTKESETHYINQWTKISEPTADESARTERQEHKVNIAMEIRKSDFDASKLRKCRSNLSMNKSVSSNSTKSRSRSRSHSRSRNSESRAVHRRRSNTRSRSRTRSRSPERRYRSYRARYSSNNYYSSRSRSRSHSRNRWDRDRDRDRNRNRNRNNRHDREKGRNRCRSPSPTKKALYHKNPKLSLEECSTYAEDNNLKSKSKPNAFSSDEALSESEFPPNTFKPLGAHTQLSMNVQATSATTTVEANVIAISTATTTITPSSSSTTAPSFKKFPFIGRMPLKKKRLDLEEVKKESVNVLEFRESRFTDDVSVKNIIPKPGVANITKLATPIDEHEQITKKAKMIEQQSAGTKVIMLVPTTASKMITAEPSSTNTSKPLLPDSLPSSLPEPLGQSKGSLTATEAPEAPLPASHFSFLHNSSAIPLPAKETLLPVLPLSPPPPLPVMAKPQSPTIGPIPAPLPPNFVDRDEMALLGIDADDMAAQLL